MKLLRKFLRMAANWKRIGRNQICPICKHKGHCTIAPDGKAVKCTRAPSGVKVVGKDGSISWMHRLDGFAAEVAKAVRVQREAPKHSRSEWETIFRKYRTALTDKLMASTAEELGVPREVLDDLELCRDIGCDGWRGTGDVCFPMRDGSRKVIGMRIRRPGGGYFCVPGSENGLFIPASFAALSCGPQVLLLPEGPSDVAAARALGMMAIGRPSNSGGGRLINALLRNLGVPIEAIIVADRDETHYLPNGMPFWPGWEGALVLAGQLLEVPGTRKVLSMKRAGAKDIREWFITGGQPKVFSGIVQYAEPVTARWLYGRRKQVEQQRKVLAKKAG
jgi:hypothetical protein